MITDSEPVNDTELQVITHLWGCGLLGFKEARNLLEEIYPRFKARRDADLDTEAET